MAEENISQEFRLKSIDKARNYFFKEIQQNQIWVKSTGTFVHFWTVLNIFQIWLL